MRGTSRDPTVVTFMMLNSLEGDIWTATENTPLDRFLKCLIVNTYLIWNTS